MRRKIRGLAAFAVVIATTLIAPGLALAQDSGGGINNVGNNLKTTLTNFAQPVLAGVIAVVAIFFLVQRKYSELAIWVGASLLVGWLVMSPDTIANSGRDFVNSLLGTG